MARSTIIVVDDSDESSRDENNAEIGMTVASKGGALSDTAIDVVDLTEDSASAPCKIFAFTKTLADDGSLDRPLASQKNNDARAVGSIEELNLTGTVEEVHYTPSASTTSPGLTPAQVEPEDRHLRPSQQVTDCRVWKSAVSSLAPTITTPTRKDSHKAGLTPTIDLTLTDRTRDFVTPVSDRSVSSSSCKRSKTVHFTTPSAPVFRVPESVIVANGQLKEWKSSTTSFVEGEAGRSGKRKRTMAADEMHPKKIKRWLPVRAQRKTRAGGADVIASDQEDPMPTTRDTTSGDAGNTDDDSAVWEQAETDISPCPAPGAGDRMLVQPAQEVQERRARGSDDVYGRSDCVCQ